MRYSNGITYTDSDGAIYTDADIRRKWPEASYPSPLPNEAMTALGLSVYVPAPVEPIMPSSPLTITAAQMRLQLLADGVLNEVESAVTAMPREAQILWEYAHDIERSNSLLIDSAAALLGWDSDRVDAFFIASSCK